MTHEGLMLKFGPLHVTSLWAGGRPVPLDEPVPVLRVSVEASQELPMGGRIAVPVLDGHAGSVALSTFFAFTEPRRGVALTLASEDGWTRCAQVVDRAFVDRVVELLLSVSPLQAAR